MMERLFAVGEQREIFLLMAGCGFLWSILQDGAEAVGRRWRSVGQAAEAAAALVLLALLIGVLLRTHEGMRLYGMLGAAVGALLYRCGISRVLHTAVFAVKKACVRLTKRQEKQPDGEK